jgi:hypothetical protein
MEQRVVLHIVTFKNIKDLNIHLFIAVILISAEFHGNDLIIWQPKLSHI